MSQTPSILGGLSPEIFLQTYWQKQPLLIRNALPNYQSPISPDELAGLACEEGIESRLIVEKDGPTPWNLRYGPFTDTDFQQLPETHWTLLVQECNKYVPELAQLINQFNFIPRWRVDDVMVSFAPKHGSVGPHMDQYDVFLLQGHGTRRWQISDHPVEADNAIPNIDLCIMQDFTATDEWILEPGDILYLPPGLPHFGLALEDCMTLSIGFRAPSYNDILANVIDKKLQQMEQHKIAPRYSDPDLNIQEHSGEITPSALKKVHEILKETLEDTDHIQRWFAQLVTQTPGTDMSPAAETHITSENLFNRLSNGDTLVRSEYNRFAFINRNEMGVYLFIDGKETWFESALLPAIALLCGPSPYNSPQLLAHLKNDVFAKLVTQLIDSRKLYFENDE